MPAASATIIINIVINIVISIIFAGGMASYPSLCSTPPRNTGPTVALFAQNTNKVPGFQASSSDAILKNG